MFYMSINKGKLITTGDIVSYCAPKYAKGRSLDVGAGTAKYREIIKKYVDKYETCDIEPGENIDYVEDVVQGMSFPDGAFDTIFAFQILEHVKSPDKMVSEIYRCLSKNGVCILTVPFLVAEHSDPGDYQRYTLGGIREFFTRHNFEILESDSYGRLFTVFGELIKFLFLNPYSHRKYGRIRTSIIRRLIGVCYFLDRLGFAKNPNFYPNVYIVAKK